jgi:putative membrane protein
MTELEDQLGGIRDYLAAERTLLSHVRTGLALSGFGFVVARFGTFISSSQDANGLAKWFGTALVVLGASASLLAMLDYIRVVKRLNAAVGNRVPPSTLAIAVAAIFALVGVAMAVYLITVA